MTDVFNNMPPVGAQQYRPNTVVQDVQASASVKDAIAASGFSGDIPSDSVQISGGKAKKRGPIKSLKHFIANIKKFFASAGEYIKGTTKGLVSGAAAGAIVYTAGDLINASRGKAAAKAAQAAAEAGTEPIVKAVKKIPNKFLAGVVLVGAVAINLWKSSLNATEKRSDIEHRWTGHEK